MEEWTFCSSKFWKEVPQTVTILTGTAKNGPEKKNTAIIREINLIKARKLPINQKSCGFLPGMTLQKFAQDVLVWAR